MQRLKPDQRKRPKEKERGEPLRHARTQGDHEIHLLRRVMRRVGRPHNVDRVAPAMDPIENEIDAEQQKDERPPIQLDREQTEVIPKITVDNINTRGYEYIHRLIAKRGSEVRDSLGKGQVVAFVENAGAHFKQHEEQCDRRQVCVDVRVLHFRDKYTPRSNASKNRQA